MAIVAAAAAGIAFGTRWLFGWNWAWSFGGAFLLLGLYGLWRFLRTALKIMYPPLTGRKWPSIHIAQWGGKNFDRLLSKSVRYGRHAISIDENRADFPRLRWGFGKAVPVPVKEDGGVEPFVQLWFAGNHSDIGGSYTETESRLSDVALKWMVDEVRSVPQPLFLSDRRLRLYPSAQGLQHDEIAGMADVVQGRVPRIFRRLTSGLSWPAAVRDPIDSATLHPSVAERFAEPAVPQQGGDGPYRPEALRNHENFRHLYSSE